ncbi:MAG TPA: (2Fe-2S)-binding protein [bacterium]|nr:(2Fe-2S)-binding protein [bacterium]
MTTLLVNGRRVESEADPDTALLYILRNDLGLKGSRFGCGDGMCGACTVLVDGKPATSCNLPISAVAGRPITTIEGLGDEERPHPMQRAILDLQAAQCGYCLTGVVMTGAALLDGQHAPSRSEIRAALDGVLCRCGAHDRMVRAVERAADIARAST